MRRRNSRCPEKGQVLRDEKHQTDTSPVPEGCGCDGGGRYCTGVCTNRFGGQDILRTAAKFDKNKTFDVTAVVDMEARRLVLTVDGKEISAPLKKTWKAIDHYGYTATSTETAFSAIAVEGD